MTSTDELLCCPFCGGEAEIVTLDNWYINSPVGVGCSQCPVIIAEFGEYKRFTTEAEAIAAWNTRAERTCENVNTDGYRYRFDCSACGHSVIVHDCSTRLDELPNYCPSCGRKIIEP